MESLRELYRIGRGPSSSHTMGPEKAARIFKERFPHAHSYQAVLYGSLAKTGRGHLTDQAIQKVFAPKDCAIVFDTHTPVAHPNTMDLLALTNGTVCGTCRVESVGGGKILIQGEERETAADVYPHRRFTGLKEYCHDKALTCWQYVEQMEGPEIWLFLADIWLAMKNEIYAGLSAEGELAGGLHVLRKARFLYQQKHMDETSETRECRTVCAYAFAAAEENASGGQIVTAPTCGSCGVLPSVLLYMQDKRGFTDQDILRALATAGLIGNIIKTNASISGAECGCQAEIGSACSMAAAALAALHDMDWDQIEYAAEVALEHHLGLTCDPVAGLVQIPCIERNAVAAMRAINALSLANFLTYARKISFDTVVKTMYETGRDLFSKYRETGEGGLAKHYQPN